MLSYGLIFGLVVLSAKAHPLDGSGTAVEHYEESSSAISTRNAETYRLPGNTVPTFYTLTLTIDPDYIESLEGDVEIRVLNSVATNQIVLHADGITLNSVSVVAVANENVELFGSYDLVTDDTQFLTITTNTVLAADTPYLIRINYNALYFSDMFGAYVSSYQDVNGISRNLVTTQFQPTFARRVFPCFDEPALKAVFRVSIYAPPAFPTVLANMDNRIISNNLPAKDGYVIHEFEDTVIMSSYLLAFVVSDFTYITNENEVNPAFPKKFRIFSRPGTDESATFALDFGQRNLLALEQYTDIEYVISKMDKIAIPDFAAGAMENWGLVTYREVALMVQDGVTTTARKESVASIIAHENMHQWFGNEVSPAWWNYLWLNEGFANFFQSFSTDLVNPEYRMMEQYVVDNVQGVFQNDAVLNVNPMTTEVYTPSEVLGNFNAVAYQKSGSVIRMMQHFLTAEVFREGLSIFVRDNSGRAATPTELYAALAQAATNHNLVLPASIATILNNWTTQPGFPVITISRQGTADANSLTVQQRRYFTDPTNTSPTVWWIPLNFVLSTDPDFSDTTASQWAPASSVAANLNVPGLTSANWYIINKQETGYYRVNYDEENWRNLVDVLNSDNFEVIHLLNRAQLIDDSLNLARTGDLSYDIAFSLVNYLSRETDYIPWASASAGFRYLNTILAGSDSHENFRRFVLERSAPIYERLGFESQASDEHVTKFFRSIALNLNCGYGNQECLNRAQELLTAFRENPTQIIDPDIQTQVYCYALRNGDPADYTFLWNRYLSSTDASEQVVLLGSLGCTSNQQMVDEYLGHVIDDSSPVREQDRHTVVVSVINGGGNNLETAFTFIRNNFLAIRDRVQGLSGMRNILLALSAQLTTEEHQQQLQEFYDNYSNQFTAAEEATTTSAIDNLRAARSWIDEHLSSVESWLEEALIEETEEPVLESSANLALSSLALSAAAIMVAVAAA